jgi:hypothetical protein
MVEIRRKLFTLVLLLLIAAVLWVLLWQAVGPPGLQHLFVQLPSLLQDLSTQQIVVDLLLLLLAVVVDRVGGGWLKGSRRRRCILTVRVVSILWRYRQHGRLCTIQTVSHLEKKFRKTASAQCSQSKNVKPPSDWVEIRR